MKRCQFTLPHLSFFLSIAVAMTTVNATAQKGLLHEWIVESGSAMARKIEATQGAQDAVFVGDPKLEIGNGFPTLECNGKNTSFLVSKNHATIKLPLKAFTLEAWCRIDSATAWGGIISCIEDNGSKGDLTGGNVTEGRRC